MITKQKTIKFEIIINVAMIFRSSYCRENSMLRYLIPRFPLADLPVLVKYVVIGIIISGSYGILHDQITFSIGPEYFRNFKYEQFAFADFGLPERIFVGLIGFLATWWVGAIVGWTVGRRVLPNQSRTAATKQVLRGFAIVFFTGAFAGFLGYLYGLWRGYDADYSMWQPILHQHKVIDHWSFMRVGYIHNAGYLGAIIGLALTFVFIRPAKATEAKESE